VTRLRGQLSTVDPSNLIQVMLAEGMYKCAKKNLSKGRKPDFLEFLEMHDAFVA
jgi:hypothetical protein